MAKIININENKNEVEIMASKYDVLKKWAENCNCTSIEKLSFIRYLVSFKNHDDMKYFVASATINC